MSHNTLSFHTRELLINPMFYDALRGPFTLPSDPETVRTLGQLLRKTFTDGEHTSRHSTCNMSAHSNFIYKPDWAKDTTVEIRGGSVLSANGHLDFAPHILSLTSAADVQSSIALDSKARSGGLVEYTLSTIHEKGDMNTYDLPFDGSNQGMVQAAVAEFAVQAFTEQYK